ncbi:MAG: hypothetical protein CBARDCOR_4181 [uncultured Caballeronia sp.]|nr:MAG: hypothetical protein CBARDCOR_4181 [uncultured Caballeronia sp.]
MLALQVLGVTLIELPKDALKRMPCRKSSTTPSATPAALPTTKANAGNCSMSGVSCAR